jgi:uncharacterized protein YndB with AHSA1/START domain
MNQIIRPASVKRTVTVNAPPATAFRVFTDGLDRWWPKTHRIGGVPMGRAVLEPRQGGRWYEVGENGVECDWGEVVLWDPPARLVLAWRINDQWEYRPEAYSEVEVLFTPLADGQTRVDLEHRGLEGLGDGEAVRTAISGPGGWTAIMESFKAAAES